MKEKRACLFIEVTGYVVRLALILRAAGCNNTMMLPKGKAISHRGFVGANSIRSGSNRLTIPVRTALPF